MVEKRAFNSIYCYRPNTFYRNGLGAGFSRLSVPVEVRKVPMRIAEGSSAVGLNQRLFLFGRRNYLFGDLIRKIAPDWKAFSQCPLWIDDQGPEVMIEQRSLSFVGDP